MRIYYIHVRTADSRLHCSSIQWCGVVHEMMQFECCVMAVFLWDCLSNTCSQLAVDLQVVGEGGAIDGKVHYCTTLAVQTHAHMHSHTRACTHTHTHTSGIRFAANRHILIMASWHFWFLRTCCYYSRQHSKY